MKKTLNFDHYKQSLFVGQKAFRKQLLFQNKLHKVHTFAVNKLALSRNNDMRVIQSDNVSTLAHGHKNTPESVTKNEPKNLASDILEWSKFGKMNVTMRRVDVKKDLV